MHGPPLSQGVDLDVSAPGGDELVVFVLGDALQPVPLALPAPALPGCSLLVVPSVTTWSPLGPAGTATLAVRQASFLAQAVTLDVESLRLTASSVLQIDVLQWIGTQRGSAERGTRAGLAERMLGLAAAAAIVFALESAR